MQSKCKQMLEDMKKYENITFNNNIEDRLNKVMELYMSDLDSTCENILAKKRKDVVMKELNK